MKRDAIYSTTIALLIGLLALMSSCDFRELLDQYPVNGVKIEISWPATIEELPQHVRVIFYPKDQQGRYVEGIISAKGEEMKVPPGQYSMMVYSYNSPVVKVRNDHSYQAIEAFTGQCTGLDTSQPMVWAPGSFYVVAQEEVTVTESIEPQTLQIEPMQVTEHYRFEIKVKGMQYVSRLMASVSGMNTIYKMAQGSGAVGEAPIYVETTLKEEGIEGRFSTFSRTGASAKSQKKNEVIMTLLFVKTDQSVQEVKVDITTTLPPPGGQPEPGQQPDSEIELPLDQEVEVDKAEPGGGGGGGFEGEVDDWGNGTDIVLPMN